MRVDTGIIKFFSGSDYTGCILNNQLVNDFTEATTKSGGTVYNVKCREIKDFNRKSKPFSFKLEDPVDEDGNAIEALKLMIFNEDSIKAAVQVWDCPQKAHMIEAMDLMCTDLLKALSLDPTEFKINHFDKNGRVTMKLPDKMPSKIPNKPGLPWNYEAYMKQRGYSEGRINYMYVLRKGDMGKDDQPITENTVGCKWGLCLYKESAGVLEDAINRRVATLSKKQPSLKLNNSVNEPDAKKRKLETIAEDGEIPETVTPNDNAVEGTQSY